MTKKYNLSLDSLQETFTIDGVDYSIFNKSELENLLKKHQDYQSDIKELRSVIVSVLKLLGIYDEATGSVKSEIASGEESYFKHILKALNKIVMLLVTAQVSKKAQAELEETFSFITKIFPIINKHGS